MRIAVNARFLLPGKLEGLGWYTHELARRMALAHPEDEFIFFFDRPYDPAFVYAENVRPVVVFPPARHPLLWYCWFEWALPHFLRRFQPDVLFSPDAYLSLRSKIPTVLTVHDLLPLQHPEQVPWGPRVFYRHFLPKYIQKAEAVVTVSEYTRQAILAAVPVPPEKVSVAYNGCRDAFRPLNESDQAAVRQRYTGGAPYFFYAGAIHPRKNVDRLIRAFDRFKSETGSDLRLVLGGRQAWQTGPVEDALRRSPNRAHILPTGYLQESELAALMASAVGFTYVSLGEGFGLPLLEAMYCDTPVICSNTTALPEVAGPAALLVDPLSEQAIAEAMKKIAADENCRAALIAEGRIRRAQFTWDGAAAEIYQLMQIHARQT
jgi:glycosyltransferase involved in cell wall biosynthesis